MPRRERDSERRERTRHAREERHGGGTSHETRVCPSCRRSLPYVEPLQDPPSECGECGYLWDCPECGREFKDADRNEAGDPPATCPACDTPVEGGYESDEADDEFEWT